MLDAPAGAVVRDHLGAGRGHHRGVAAGVVVVLVTIDPAPYAAEVERAEAQLAAAQARVTYTKSGQARAQRLWEERAIAQREYDERSNALREAEASLRAAQAALQSNRLNLSYTQVRAPLAGRVGRIEVTARRRRVRF